MIYLDTSVVLAYLLAEDRRPPDQLWHEVLVSSRLLEYEIWNRINARGLARSHGESVRSVMARVAILELSITVLVRATEPFRRPVRTLDALHLASADFLRQQKQTVEVASYDERFLSAATAMGFTVSRHCERL